jgi:hypothetical protein
MVDQWWPALFFIGLAMLALAWPFYADLYTRLTEPWRWMTLAVVGALAIFGSLLLVVFRHAAYIQLFDTHLRLATPFLRMNISYRRIRRTTTAGMATLFPPKSLSGMKRDVIGPLLSRTAVVIDLNALPIRQSTLRLFLSPFFFRGRMPSLVIVVKDWMGFSTQLESMRSGRQQPPAPTRPRPPSSILSKLSHK